MKNCRGVFAEGESESGKQRNCFVWLNRGETSRVNFVAIGLNINYELRQSKLYKRYIFSKVQKTKVTGFKVP